MSVYFAASSGYVKIGQSDDPFTRILTTSIDKTVKPDDFTVGAEVQLLGWFPGGFRAERKTLGALDDFCVIGEWFRDCPEVRDYLRDQDEAVVLAEMSALAVFEVLRGVPVAEAMSLYPMRTITEAMTTLFERKSA